MRAGYPAARKAVLDYVADLSTPPSADERQQAIEECAKVCDAREELMHAYRDGKAIHGAPERSMEAAICAAAIRALSSAPKAR